MATTRLFLSNRTQAVRLPREVAFPKGVEEVKILVVGDSRVIVPAGRRWDAYFAEGPFVDEDFLADRTLPPLEERESLG